MEGDKRLKMDLLELENRILSRRSREGGTSHLGWVIDLDLQFQRRRLGGHLFLALLKTLLQTAAEVTELEDHALLKFLSAVSLRRLGLGRASSRFEGLVECFGHRDGCQRVAGCVGQSAKCVGDASLVGRELEVPEDSIGTRRGGGRWNRRWGGRRPRLVCRRDGDLRLLSVGLAHCGGDGEVLGRGCVDLSVPGMGRMNEWQ